MSFKSNNLSYMFHKEYYATVYNANLENDGEEAVARVNRQLAATRLPLESRQLGTHTISMQVQYPGLVIGSGYAHVCVDENGDEIRGHLTLGSCFDYVTGSPYIPGPSVKGTLRNAFSIADGVYIKAFFGDDTLDVVQLEKEIFGGADTAESIHLQDVFFDAFPSPSTLGKNADGLYRLLDLDVITPNGDGITITPSPQCFLKVRPGVVFDFPFILHDGMITAQQKYELFKQILLDFGIGGKTSIGYGRLEEAKAPPAPAAEEGSDEIKRIACPHCGIINNKYRKDSDVINICWQKNECYRCGGNLQ